MKETRHINAARILAIALIVATPVAVHAAELFTPGLPATGTQFLECRVINVSNSSQTTTTEAFDSTGAVAAGPFTETLSPGATGGFSVSAVAGAVYCKFTVSGPASRYRASIDVLDSTTTPPSIVVALPAQ